jgi:hypothetical protein
MIVVIAVQSCETGRSCREHTRADERPGRCDCHIYPARPGDQFGARSKACEVTVVATGDDYQNNLYTQR